MTKIPLLLPDQPSGVADRGAISAVPAKKERERGCGSILIFSHHERFVQHRRMSYIFTCVRVAQATTDVQNILVIPATDEIHMKNRNHGQHAKQSCGLKATFESCSARTTKKNLPIVLANSSDRSRSGRHNIKCK